MWSNEEKASLFSNREFRLIWTFSRNGKRQGENHILLCRERADCDTGIFIPRKTWDEKYHCVLDQHPGMSEAPVRWRGKTYDGKKIRHHPIIRSPRFCDIPCFNIRLPSTWLYILLDDAAPIEVRHRQLALPPLYITNPSKTNLTCAESQCPGAAKTRTMNAHSAPGHRYHRFFPCRDLAFAYE